MVALQITNGLQLKLYYNITTQLAINVLGMTPTGTVTVNQALAETIGAMVKSAWSAQMAPHCSTANSLVRVGIRDLRIANLPEFRDTGAAVPGTGGIAEALPAYTALVVTLRTAKAGKSFRGRVYLPGWTENENTASGTSSTAAGTAGVAFINAIGSGLQSSALKLAVLSYPSEDITIDQTTTHADGTKTVRRLSHETAKVGGAEPVTIVENRNASWEVQRRRVNARGGLPTAFDARVSMTLPT